MNTIFEKDPAEAAYEKYMNEIDTFYSSINIDHFSYSMILAKRVNLNNNDLNIVANEYMYKKYGILSYIPFFGLMISLPSEVNMLESLFLSDQRSDEILEIISSLEDASLEDASLEDDDSCF